MSRTFQAVGLEMGKKQNHHGESLFFLHLNDRVFDLADTTWDYPDLLIRALKNPEFFENAHSLFRSELSGRRFAKDYWGLLQSVRNRVGRTKNWGWKDPRTTITLPLWLRIFPKARILHICRNGIDVAWSLSTREARRKPDRPYASDRCLSIEGSFKVWQEYETAALRYSRTLAKSRYLRVRYEDIALGPQEQLPTIFDFIGRNHPSILDDLIADTNPDRAYAFLRDRRLKGFYEENRLHPIMVELGYDSAPLHQAMREQL